MTMDDTSGEYRAARRAAIRAHHPDVGGDQVSLQRALDAIDNRYARREPAPTVVRVARLSARRQAWAGFRKAARRMPSRRKYFDL
ncbi:hypothetical protein [Rhodococcoides trifolii]|uniref:hypothetical protein n=1 Tax=Rhodococcoides trifolii TaxID=908250 RepID=UPI00166DC35E|nr:hypothetical protein [Rhodococcus trifolii]